MDPSFLKTKHQAGLTYGDYLATGTAEQRNNWQQIYDAAALSDSQREVVDSFTRKMNVIGLSGIWCGDCVQQGPLIQRIAESSSAIVP